MARDRCWRTDPVRGTLRDAARAAFCPMFDGYIDIDLSRVLLEDAVLDQT
jgi:hypothetical protein